MPPNALTNATSFPTRGRKSQATGPSITIDPVGRTAASRNSKTLDAFVVADPDPLVRGLQGVDPPLVRRRPPEVGEPVDGSDRQRRPPVTDLRLAPAQRHLPRTRGVALEVLVRKFHPAADAVQPVALFAPRQHPAPVGDRLDHPSRGFAPRPGTRRRRRRSPPCSGRSPGRRSPRPRSSSAAAARRPARPSPG